MSTTVEPLPSPSPPLEVIQQAYTAHSGHGSIGPVIGILAVITILGAIAVMIGRICSGRSIMGHGQYDFEGWVDAKCGSCIDGRIDPSPRPRKPPQPQPPAAESGSNGGRARNGDALPAVGPTEAGQEVKEEEVTRPNPNESTRAVS